jgi:hypothetical protein
MIYRTRKIANRCRYERLLLERLEDRCLLSGSSYGALPLAFEVNQGQAVAGIDFVAHGSGYALSLTRATAQLGLESPGASSTGVLQMRLIGSNTAAPLAGENLLPGVANYLVGNDPSQWHTNVPTYGQVASSNVYPGVDLVYHGNQGQLEYDFVVNPGGHPGEIRLAIGGAQFLKLDAQGNLVVQTPGGTVVEQAPVVYQDINGLRRSVSGRYVLQNDRQIGFAVAAYDASRPLVIDPVLVYSTYLGGSDTDEVRAVAVDAAGNAYVAGQTFSTNFPIANALQGGFASSSTVTSDAFVAKLNATGSGFVYSTYLGGNSQDAGIGIKVDSSGNAYVVGITGSTNFPAVNAFQSNLAGSHNAFLAKLNAAGNDLVYSTYFGGNASDDGLGIAIDSAEDAYITGDTSSTNFPTMNALQSKHATDNQGYDAFVAKFAPTGTSLVYSTYLGGSGTFDFGNSIAVDGVGNAYIGGSTQSTDFPILGGVQRTYPGGLFGGFVTKLTPSGVLSYSTYLGGNNDDYVQGIAVDASGDAFVTGPTSSTNFPTAGSPFQPRLRGSGNAFVSKLNPTGNALVYSTYLGGTGGDYGSAIAVDAAGNAYVTGGTRSTDFPAANAVQSVHAADRNGQDAFITKLNSGGSALGYSTYLGGSQDELGFGIAVDASDDVYVVGRTGSQDFPTVAPLQARFAGGMNDGFVTKLLGHVWHTTDVAVNSGNQALLLWDKNDGSVDIWSVTSGFATDPGAAYGPLSGWTAVATAFGSDGLTRVLFSNADGSTALWLIASGGMFAGAGAFAPMSGWTAADVTVGSDGNTRILWTNTSGAMSIWSIDDNLNVVSNLMYGPISGWTARSIAAGGDGLTRVLWDNANSQTALWLLNASGSVVSAGVFGPFSGWTATDIAVGPDNQTRILWDNVNGSAIVWKVSNSFGVASGPVFGPFGGWTAVRVADGSDGVVRLLWDNVDGTTALWLLDAAGNFSKAGIFGPF